MTKQIIVAATVGVPYIIHVRYRSDSGLQVPSVCFGGHPDPSARSMHGPITAPFACDGLKVWKRNMTRRGEASLGRQPTRRPQS